LAADAEASVAAASPPIGSLLTATRSFSLIQFVSSRRHRQQHRALQRRLQAKIAGSPSPYRFPVEAQRALPGIRSYADSMAAAVSGALLLLPESMPETHGHQGHRALVLCSAEHGFVAVLTKD
jgi:hypothetical protein